jgi:hypothetical protein
VPFASVRWSVLCVVAGAGLVPAAYAADEPAALSADGRVRAFAADFPNGLWTGIKVHDRQTGVTENVSLTRRGEWARANRPDLDWAGRLVAFSSNEALVADDVNDDMDVYVYDRECRTTELLSARADGTAANAFSSFPAMSGDGRFVAFQSNATDLVAGDTNGAPDVFVADRATGAVERVSVTDDERQGDAAIAGTGGPAVSADGRYVAFVSTARLAAGDRDGGADLYVRDRVASTTVLVPPPGPKPDRFTRPLNVTLSADGRTVAFEWSGPAADGVWLFELGTSAARRVDVWPSGHGVGFDPAVSADGQRIAFVGDPDPNWYTSGDRVTGPVK